METGTRETTVIDAGPRGTFGSLRAKIERNASLRTVGGTHADADQTDDRALDELKVDELREEAKALGLEGLSGAKKEELVAAISAEYDRIESEGDQSPSDPEGSETDPDGSDSEE